MERVHVTGEGERRTATFSRDERYRYRLSIEWDRSLPAVAVIGLNPSTADEMQDDPTVAKIKRWAKSEGYGTLNMLNAYALRSTDPKGLWLVDDPVGPFNKEWIQELENSSETIVAAWGTNIKPERQAAILSLLAKIPRVVESFKLQCWSVTKDGLPGHPLYLKTPMTLRAFGV